MPDHAEERTGTARGTGEVQASGNGVRDSPISSNASGPDGNSGEKAANGVPNANGSQTQSEGEKKRNGAVAAPAKPPQQASEQKQPSKIKQIWEKTGLDV